MIPDYVVGVIATWFVFCAIGIITSLLVREVKEKEID